MAYAKYLAGFFCIMLAAAACPADATIAPQIYFESDPVIEKTDYVPGEKISGSVNLWNYENAAIGDLTFKYQLWGKKIDEVPTQLLNEARDAATFSLSANEKTAKQFSYALPANLPDGTFTFRVQLATGRGEELAWADKEIKISGGGNFLILENGWIVKDGEMLDTAGGVYYQPDEAASIVFDVSNNTKKPITGYYKTITFPRNTSGKPVSEDVEESVTINAGAKKTISARLPKLSVPETYFSEIKFFDPATNLPISNSIFYRWIISGENARVLFVQPDKDAYAAGEQANIEVTYTGPANAEIDLGTGTLEIKIVDNSGNVAGTASKEIDLGTKAAINSEKTGESGETASIEKASERDKNTETAPKADESFGGEVTIAVPIAKNVNDPKIIATISRNGKKLDSYVSGLDSKNEIPETPAAPEKNAEKEMPAEKNGNGTGYWAGLVVIAIFAVIAAIFIKKGKSGSKPAMMLGLIAGGMLTASGALAATEVVKGIGDSTITFTKPVPGQIYVAGNDITFAGKFQVTSCGNGLFFNRVSYYITEDKEIPVSDCLGYGGDTRKGAYCTCNSCINCYGSTSAYYKNLKCQTATQSAKDAKGNPYTYKTFLYGDSVKDLDTSKGFKIFPLGTVYPGDSRYINGTRWTIEYDKTFTIPEDIDLEGPVRFYVVYSGTHWIGHWHWNITYQKGTLVKGPTATTLTAAQPDHCESEPKETFSWSFMSGTAEAVQSAYQIQLASDSGFSTIVYDSKKTNSGSNSFALPLNIIGYNKTYYWRVKVWDDKHVESFWNAGQPFTTPKYHAPEVDFSLSKGRLVPGETINFIQDSKPASYCYSAAGKKLCQDTPGVSYEWDFGDGTTSTTIGNATHAYAEEGTYEASLKITSAASAPAACEKVQKIFIKADRPQDWSDGEPF